MTVPCLPSSERFSQRYRRSEEHTSELQSRGHLVCRLLPAEINTIIVFLSKSTTFLWTLPLRATPPATFSPTDTCDTRHGAFQCKARERRPADIPYIAVIS